MKTERHALTYLHLKATLRSRKKTNINQMKEKTFYIAIFNTGENFRENVYLILMNVFKCTLWMFR